MGQFEGNLRKDSEQVPGYNCGDCGYKVINSRCGCFGGKPFTLESDLDHYLETGWHLLPGKLLDQE